MNSYISHLFLCKNALCFCHFVLHNVCKWQCWIDYHELPVVVTSRVFNIENGGQLPFHAQMTVQGSLRVVNVLVKVGGRCGRNCGFGNCHALVHDISRTIHHRIKSNYQNSTIDSSHESRHAGNINLVPTILTIF